ncbi:MAG: hypothetical protein PUG60_09305 [Lachnospiraceae bacterium]|nr:hypothetical protein [Lachnospiraceae bacterium]MDY4971442.1 hypothetical protein [Lachnospiraceae bacterium]
METGKNREVSAAGSPDGIELTDSEKKRFQRLYQEGICRELHRRGLLTEDQLNTLFNRISDSRGGNPEEKFCDDQGKTACGFQEKTVCGERRKTVCNVQGRAALWTECREKN